MTGNYDLVAHSPDVLAFVVAGVGVEVDAQDRGEHSRREILGVIASLLFGLTEAVVQRDISVESAVLGDCDANGCGELARLVGGVLAQRSMDDLSWFWDLSALLGGYQFAMRGKGRGDAGEVILRDGGTSERHREAHLILDRYSGAQIHKIDGSGSRQQVWKDIEHALAAPAR